MIEYREKLITRFMDSEMHFQKRRLSTSVNPEDKLKLMDIEKNIALLLIDKWESKFDAREIQTEYHL
jgi:hypothetical protein